MFILTNDQNLRGTPSYLVHSTSKLVRLSVKKLSTLDSHHWVNPIPTEENPSSEVKAIQPKDPPHGTALGIHLNSDGDSNAVKPKEKERVGTQFQGSQHAVLGM